MEPLHDERFTLLQATDTNNGDCVPNFDHYQKEQLPKLGDKLIIGYDARNCSICDMRERSMEAEEHEDAVLGTFSQKNCSHFSSHTSGVLLIHIATPTPTNFFAKYTDVLSSPGLFLPESCNPDAFPYQFSP